ncbi:MAG: Ig domain-containing protein [Terriglobales bacterium]
MLWLAVLAYVWQLAAGPLQITTTYLPPPIAGQVYSVQLRAEGGVAPYHWAAERPGLPPGLRLNPDTGLISGQARPGSRFSTLIAVTDSSPSPVTVRKLLLAAPEPPLILQWTQTPQVTGQNIEGAVEAQNGLDRDAVVTVIVVAVNRDGKAFVLRYDHRVLPSGRTTPSLAFSVFEPAGTYVVHVDGVAEVYANGQIFRERLETPGLVVAGPP